MAFQARVTNVPNMQTFIDALVNFAVANGGFTDEGTTVDGVRSVKRGDIYWSFYTGPAHTLSYTTVYPMYSRMIFQKPTSVAEVAALSGQPALTMFSGWKGGGPYISFYLFQADHAIHGVLEVLPNVFIHYSFGVINKNGNVVGGEYITSTSMIYNSYVGGASVYTFHGSHARNLYPFDGGYGEYNTSISTEPRARPGFIRHIQNGVQNNNASDFAPIGQTAYGGKRALMATMSGFLNSMIYYFGINSFNQRSPIMPIYVRSQDVSNPSVYYHIGEVPGVGFLNGSSIPEAGIVDLDWQVFPIVSRENPTDATQYQSPLRRSLAYLRA